jgi:hypothetical protein
MNIGIYEYKILEIIDKENIFIRKIKVFLEISLKVAIIMKIIQIIVFTIRKPFHNILYLDIIHEIFTFHNEISDDIIFQIRKRNTISR